MSIDLNHTIVHSRDKQAEAEFFARILGLEVGAQWGPFVPVQAGNGVTFDFMDSTEIQPQHYAFLVTDEEFDQIFARVKESGITYWSDPAHRRPGEINHHYGGRGVYFDSPDGHNLEAITAPYA
ncbi:VOC family protein [Spirillospora sp. NPDC047279]|uniref:VOC family protein n=1 Tax=Spirillospora sp. NPDC047279 TaxID=3155478 RepID=UPI0033FC62E2